MLGFPWFQGPENGLLQSDSSAQAVLSGFPHMGDCVQACSALKTEFGDYLHLPEEQELYLDHLSGYWSLQQSTTQPACIFVPRTARDISSALEVVKRTKCPFATKSGGHAAFKGSSNIPGGITIDLIKLNEITIAPDRKTVSVGAGNRWIDVYHRLEPKNLVVIGGRVAPIGVGGLTLGGGISYFSNTYGWACDNVASYEVVTASGKVVVASPDTHQDLYWALRGGGNNFGIVTKLEMYSYPLDHEAMWIGKVMHSADYNASLVQAFVDYAQSGSKEDLKSTILFNFIYLQGQDQYLSMVEVEYPDLVVEGAHPAVYDDFFSIPDALQTTKATKSLSTIAQEHSDANPNGKRQSYWTTTFRIDLELVHYVTETWRTELESIRQSIAGFLPVLTLQVITTSMMEEMKQRGGNPLGLDNESDPLLFVVVSAMWTDAKDDEAVMEAYRTWLDKSVMRAKELGLHHPYVYMNYASQFQDPIRGYGTENSQRLRKVAQRYDADGLFQRLQPGYFKL